MLDIVAQDIEEANGLLRAGAALQDQGEFVEAQDIFQKVYEQFPKNDVTNYGYGNNFYELGELEEAEKYVRQAIRINAGNPQYWLTLICIGGKGDDGRKLQKMYKEALARFPEIFALVENQMLLQIQNWELKENIATTDRLLKSPNLKPDQKQLVAAARALALYLRGDIGASRELVFSLMPQDRNPADGFNSIKTQFKTYSRYLDSLLRYREDNNEFYGEDAAKEIYVLGDSHVLSPSYMVIEDSRLIPKLCLGVKAWHLSDNRQNRFKHIFYTVSETIPEGASGIFNYGEIDCRLDGGIFSNYLRNPGMDLAANINELVADYIEYIGKRIKNKRWMPIIAGVPAPDFVYNQESCPDEAVLTQYIQVPRLFNAALKERAAAANYKFADFYVATADAKGWAKPGCHIDQIHMIPEFYLEVMAPLL